MEDEEEAEIDRLLRELGLDLPDVETDEGDGPPVADWRDSDLEGWG
jgi:hypothetical protein